MPTPEELMAAGGDRGAIANALMAQQGNWPNSDFLVGIGNTPNVNTRAFYDNIMSDDPSLESQNIEYQTNGVTTQLGNTPITPGSYRGDTSGGLQNYSPARGSQLAIDAGANSIRSDYPPNIIYDAAAQQFDDTDPPPLQGGKATTNYPYDDTLTGGRSPGAGFSDLGRTGYYGSFDPYSTSSGLGTSDPYGRNQSPNYATVPTQQTNYDQYPDYQQVGRGGYAGYGGNARSLPLDPYDQGSSDTITRDYDLRSQPTPQQMARTNEFPSRRGDPLEPIPPQEPFDPPPDPGQDPEPQQRGDPSARFTVRSQIPDAEYPDEVPPPDVSPEVSPSRVAQQPSRGGGVPDDYYSQPAGGPYTSGGEAGYTSLDFQLPDRIGYGQQAVTALPYNDDLHGAYARADANDYSAAARRGTPGVNYAAQIAAILAAQGRGV